MVDQLNAFANEVTRVAREVGTEGRLGGQAEVYGVGGVWKDLTDNVNIMAGNLTSQVRNIAEVTTAVQQGDLSKKITVDVRGEILELKQTINTMVDQLNAFAKEVTRVGREVGAEGRLGGQANVPGAAGTWRDLTDNVNQLSATLTTQVRAIAEVATAVTKGDLTQSIRVDAKGEVANLKDNINEMIGNLRVTTEKNTEQDWLKTNLTRFTRMLQGQRDPMTGSKMILSGCAPSSSWRHSSRSAPPISISWTSSPRASASCSTRSTRTAGPKTCSPNRSPWPPSCRASRTSCSAQTTSSQERRGSWRSRTPRLNKDGSRSNRPRRWSRRKPSSWR